MTAATTNDWTTAVSVVVNRGVVRSIHATSVRRSSEGDHCHEIPVESSRSDMVTGYAEGTMHLYRLLPASTLRIGWDRVKRILGQRSWRTALSLLLAAACAAATVPAAAAGTAHLGDAPPMNQQATPKDIVDTAVGAGQFKTLVQAVQAAGLVDTLKGPGPFTVFAPTDEAFAKLPKATLDSLLANPSALRDVLTYHVVSGTVQAADVVKLSTAKTVQGGNISIAVSGSTVRLNGSVTVTQTDIKASNGVIHVIDTVLLPPSMQTATPAPAKTGNAGLGSAPRSSVWLVAGAAVAAGMGAAIARRATAR